MGSISVSSDELPNHIQIERRSHKGLPDPMSWLREKIGHQRIKLEALPQLEQWIYRLTGMPVSRLTGSSIFYGQTGITGERVNSSHTIFEARFNSKIMPYVFIKL